jgi:hypothetical protein
MEWFREVSRNTHFLFWFFVVGVPCLMLASIEITKLIIRHCERIEMIRHGMHPDTPYARKNPDARERTA